MISHSGEEPTSRACFLFAIGGVGAVLYNVLTGFISVAVLHSERRRPATAITAPRSSPL